MPARPNHQADAPLHPGNPGVTSQVDWGDHNA
jgi:hypothetical protein